MEQIGHIIQGLLKEHQIEDPIQKYQALTLWSSVVGQSISDVTKPQRISDGKLFIQVQNDAWRQELFYHKRDILQKLNFALGSNLVKDIVLI